MFSSPSRVYDLDPISSGTCFAHGCLNSPFYPLKLLSKDFVLLTRLANFVNRTRFPSIPLAHYLTIVGKVYEVEVKRLLQSLIYWILHREVNLS